MPTVTSTVTGTGFTIAQNDNTSNTTTVNNTYPTPSGVSVELGGSFNSTYGAHVDLNLGTQIVCDAEL
jgi:hypothetical protein